jgi:hypothetical protein
MELRENPVEYMRQTVKELIELFVWGLGGALGYALLGCLGWGAYAGLRLCLNQPGGIETAAAVLAELIGAIFLVIIPASLAVLGLLLMGAICKRGTEALERSRV